MVTVFTINLILSKRKNTNYKQSLIIMSIHNNPFPIYYFWTNHPDEFSIPIFDRTGEFGPGEQEILNSLSVFSIWQDDNATASASDIGAIVALTYEDVPYYQEENGSVVYNTNLNRVGTMLNDNIQFSEYGRMYHESSLKPWTRR